MESEMEINISELKSGDKIKFRCGGEAVVGSSRTRGMDILGISLKYIDENLTEEIHWFLNGNYQFSKGHPFDIIEIISAPFD